MLRTTTLIAIVDTDQAYIDFASELLVEEGYQTVTCVREHEAYALIWREKPDLVILDTWLERPDSGCQLLALIRSDSTITAIPVIICSADSRYLREKEQQLRAQRCDILEKPFDLDMLLEKVQAAVGPARQAQAHCRVVGGRYVLN